MSNITKKSFGIQSAMPVRNLKNKSSHYIRRAKEKEKEKEKLLQIAIDKGKQEFQYKCLIKMGEANELS